MHFVAAECSKTRYEQRHTRAHWCILYRDNNNKKPKQNQLKTKTVHSNCLFEHKVRRTVTQKMTHLYLYGFQDIAVALVYGT